MTYYLLIQFKRNGQIKVDRLAVLEDGIKFYEDARKDESNEGVYLSAILKEITW